MDVRGCLHNHIILDVNSMKLQSLSLLITTFKTWLRTLSPCRTPMGLLFAWILSAHREGKRQHRTLVVAVSYRQPDETLFEYAP